MHRSVLLMLLSSCIAFASAARRSYPHPHHHSRLTTNSVQDQQDKIASSQDETAGIKFNSYSKHYSGRHVCTSQKNVTHPVKTKQAFCKPTYKKYMVQCNGNQLCSGVRLVYETHYKDVYTTRNTNEVTYLCCPGWTQSTTRSHGCNKPLCLKPCLNGGICIKPGHCSCPKDFTGLYCEIDATITTNTSASCSKPCQNGGTCSSTKGACVCHKGFHGSHCERDLDECKEYKPCDQLCHNTPGSYRCECKENFALQLDGQSCRKENDDGTAIEAKDLEFEMLDKRLLKLENMMGENHKNITRDSDLDVIHKDIDNITKDLTYLKDKLNYIDHYKNDLFIFKNKLSKIESKADKIDDLVVKYEKMKKCAFYNKICI